MKHKTIWTILMIELIAIFVVSAYFIFLEDLGNLVFGDKPTIISCGFSQEMKEMLKQQYSLTIPEDAELIQGYYTNSFRDPTIVIEFEYTPSEDFFKEYQNAATKEAKNTILFNQGMLLVSDNSWEGTPIPIAPTFQENLVQSETTYMYKLIYMHEEFTCLLFSLSESGKIQCCFYGHAPSSIVMYSWDNESIEFL